MKILICCALPLEFNEARNQLKLKELTTKKDLPRIASSGNIDLLCTGPGKVNSSVNLYSYLLNNNPDLVIDTGTCGSLSEKIKTMEIVVSGNAIEFFSPEITGSKIVNNCLEDVKKILPKIIFDDITIATLEDKVNNINIVNKLIKQETSVVTWETSSIFYVCSKLKIPFISIRGVTDSCNENTDIDFKANRIVLCKKLYNYVKNLCIGI